MRSRRHIPGKQKIVLVGPPGAGKGTQATRMSKLLNLPHISTGSLLRDAVQSEEPLGLQVKTCIEAGKLVPDGMIVDLVAQRLREKDSQTGFILDGFPRTIRQAENLDRILERTNTDLDCCLSIAIDNEEAVARILQRRQREFRSDDSEKIVRERIRQFDSQTAPLLDYYREKGLLIEVSGMGTVDEITAEIASVLSRTRTAVT